MKDSKNISWPEFLDLAMVKLGIKRLGRFLRKHFLTGLILFFSVGTLALAPFVLTSTTFGQELKERMSFLSQAAQVAILFSILAAIHQTNRAKQEMDIKVAREGKLLAVKQAEKFAASIIPSVCELRDKIETATDASGKMLNLRLQNIHLEDYCIDEVGHLPHKTQIYFDQMEVFFRLNSKIRYEAVDLLNKFEAFAMYFSQGLANEEAVFSSLGIAYCDYVEKMAVLLCIARQSKDTFYYGNVISLYHTWHARNESLKLPHHKKMIEKLRMSGKMGARGSTERLIESSME